MSRKFLDGAVLGWAILTVGFHLYLIFTGLLPNLVTRPMHLLLALPWIFIIGTRGTALSRAISAAVGLIGMAACLYVILDRERLLDQYGALQGGFQYLLAAILILVVLDMARRAIKPVLPTVAVIVLAYGFFGDLIPANTAMTACRLIHYWAHW